MLGLTRLNLDIFGFRNNLIGRSIVYELKISDTFASPHFLREYNGPCENLHGHTYKLEITLQSDQLNDLGLVVDFREVKQKLKKFLEHLDHICLNDVPFFKENNPSTENISRYIYEEFSKQAEGYTVKKVRVWESDCSSVTYYK